MRNTIIALFSFFAISTTAQAADVICSCESATECSDILINFVPSNPGVYMTVEYAYGEKNLEGFAQVTRDSKNDRVVYKLGNFILVEKDSKYLLAQKAQTCN